MPFKHRGIEYFLGHYSTKTYTISIPAIKNYFKEVEVKNVDTAHSKAQTVIEDFLNKK